MTALFDLTGKVAIVTGGSGGIGRALSIGLAKHGADITVTSRTLAKLEPVADEIRGLGKRALAVTSDVTDEQSVAHMVDSVLSKFLRIDILVNCAGIAVRNAAEDFPISKWKQIMDFNALGTFICCQAVGKIMMKHGGGKIINLSSIRGISGAPGAAAYGPSKGAVDALTRNLACEWGKYNIHVNAIAPSLIESELTRSLMTPEKKRSLAARIALGRVAVAEDVVGPAIFLASDASGFLTGQIIHLDGGMSAGIT